MNDLISLLLGNTGVSSLSKSTGASNQDVENVLSNALPLLLSGMTQNASTKQGASSLSKALDDHADDDNDVDGVDLEDGMKILNNIFGGATSTKKVTKSLATNSKLSGNQISTILSAAAPLLLSYLGSQKKSSKKSNDSSDITSLLFSVLGGGSSSNNAMGSILSLLGGGSSKKSSSGGLDSILTSLLGVEPEEEDTTETVKKTKKTKATAVAGVNALKTAQKSVKKKTTVKKVTTSAKTKTTSATKSTAKKTTPAKKTTTTKKKIVSVK